MAYYKLETKYEVKTRFTFEAFMICL
jgi:hypothetical protein